MPPSGTTEGSGELCGGALQRWCWPARLCRHIDRCSLAAHPPVCRERSIRESHPEGPQLQQALATFRQVGAAGTCVLVLPASSASGVVQLATYGLEYAAVRPFQLSPPSCAPTRLQEVAVIERALAPLLPALAAGPPPGSEQRPAYF